MSWPDIAERRWHRPPCNDVGSQYVDRYGDSTAVLKVIRWRTGSQCSWHRTDVMRSDLLAPVTRRAAAFWTDCSLCSSWPLTPARMLLLCCICWDLWWRNNTAFSNWLSWLQHCPKFSCWLAWQFSYKPHNCVSGDKQIDRQTDRQKTSLLKNPS